jgi:hypothetical protein
VLVNPSRIHERPDTVHVYRNLTAAQRAGDGGPQLRRDGTARFRERSLLALNLIALLIGKQFRLTDDVDEQDMPVLELLVV